MPEHFSSEELERIYTNPFYCLSQVHEIYIEEHEPMIPEEQWIEANVKLIEEIGSEKWLTLLLENLKGNTLPGIDPKDN